MSRYALCIVIGFVLGVIVYYEGKLAPAVEIGAIEIDGVPFRLVPLLGGE